MMICVVYDDKVAYRVTKLPDLAFAVGSYGYPTGQEGKSSSRQNITQKGQQKSKLVHPESKDS